LVEAVAIKNRLGASQHPRTSFVTGGPVSPTGWG
jgi:hypothetical protein